METAGTKKGWQLASAVLTTFTQFTPAVLIYLVIQELVEYAAIVKVIDRDLLFRLGFISL